MRIGIDARMYGLEHAGVGRYVMKLVETVLKFDKKNEYVLFLRKNHVADFKNRKKVKVVETNVSIYSLPEQLLLPIIFSREKLDLLHLPHFNAPLFYPSKYILTVHDLIKHDSKGQETTTRQPWLYFVKRLGYLFLTSLITKRAAHIIVPSEYVKNDIVKRLKVKESKITVTHEAVSGSLKEVELTPTEKRQVLAKFGLHQPFVVYTGNVYPHKNVDLLINAIAIHNQNREVDLELALICSRSVFWERLNQKIKEKKLGKWIKMLGYLEDKDVSEIYSLALALVHPSKMEGFGLTGLEAMSLGLPVVSSRASCLPEVYGEAALFFDPDIVEDLVEKLERIIKDADLRNDLISKGYHQARKYSWDKMGKETIAVYQQVLK
ncbi:MAG: hypothetical protein UW68_C0051G0003 [Candidatus Collierbacteria bacterium GW2011_GWB1_44_6]|uniref:Glycosyl transferase, group 1 n=1 Tax=Candidatus Collierbacteria bacterium GW2011_GWB1_44_6 TaxID=1618384 RepID=A0A0G1LT16_9BACT|nr:MAG: hypothetical protein UT79_C0010G0001 [Candidatus Moranbacteria bacterium GW2011_GWC2_40_12]KKT71977.1 MAG: hypothetical protein UW68_C0051G0003 [Candidatus Collierbacteria bacterium GW2011_GWB1_44_6]KKT81390.1 MAG: hypothetical protein UW80_C0052G0001 [Microgenomates group bacterium GW2011_GWC1_44_9]